MSTDPQELRVVDAYDEDYFERGLQTGRSNYENYRWLPELTIPMAHYLSVYLGLWKGSSVLDYGCAKGYLVKSFRLLGIEAYGCDISKYAISHADPDVAQYLELIDDSMTIPFDRRFDWVISKDVLEHMYEEQLDWFLKDSRRLSDNQFHVVPIGGSNGKFVVPEYDMDSTHVLCRDANWWKEKFRSRRWPVDEFHWALTGIKDNWTGRYPAGNGFFLLEKQW